MALKPKDKEITNHGKFDFIVSGKFGVYVEGDRRASKRDIISVRIPHCPELGMNVGKHMTCEIVAHIHKPYIYRARVL